MKAGIYLRKGRGALAFVTNLLKTPQTVALDFHLAGWGLATYKVTDAESGEEVTGQPLTVEPHDFRLLRVDKK